MLFIQSQYSIAVFCCFYNNSFICFSAYTTEAPGFFISYLYLIFFYFYLIIFFSTFFIETNSSWLIYKWIKVLKIKTSISFNLVFPRNTVLSYFFLFFLLIDLYLLIPTVVAQIFNPTAELIIPTGIPTNKINTEMETHSVIATVKIRKYSTQIKFLHVFLCFLLISSLRRISSKRYFLFLIYFFSIKSRLAFFFAIFPFKVLIYYL